MLTVIYLWYIINNRVHRDRVLKLQRNIVVELSTNLKTQNKERDDDNEKRIDHI